ncbi:nucleotidyltransferase family protein [Paenibacillus wynnii]|uniref:Nucleotidyltransferase family protein n=1 Tax=Paenibacillus wynnii TaxID=268407 RepID=A0A098MDW0_9BACL|nr:nucleotidyltransferase family protein [Paenibacillus wynnii]KGE19747.1 hypothetical protein PWYN_10650 [Paenibacillus wynnii]
MLKETQLILLAVLKTRSDQEEAVLAELMGSKIDWARVAGVVMHHRLEGYFLRGIPEDLRRFIALEFIKSLSLLIKAQRKLTMENIGHLTPLLEELEREGIRYAGLKGLVYNASIYTPGDRRSNDSDILVSEEDLERLDAVLRRHGFIQSFSSVMKEASRKEKLIQRMHHHDLVPYAKLTGGDFLERIQIDVNFHFDSKDNDITKAIFDYGTENYANEYYVIKGLKWPTHLAHLCVHFYREGTNTIWTMDRRDAAIYKMIDAVNTLRLHSDEVSLLEWCALMRSFRLQKQCYYTLYHMNLFYPGLITERVLAELKPDDDAYLQEVTVHGTGERLSRSSSIFESAFDLTYCVDFSRVPD